MITTSADSEPLSNVMGTQVRRARERRRWTHQDLADRMTELGFPVDRSVLSRLERGADADAPARAKTRADNLTVREWLVLAAALEVPPASLLLPVDTGSPVDVTPTLTVDCNIALWWIAGEEPLARLDAEGHSWVLDDGAAAGRHSPVWIEASREIWLRRRLRDLQRATEKAWRATAWTIRDAEAFEAARKAELDHRETMTAMGVSPPFMATEYRTWTRPKGLQA